MKEIKEDDILNFDIDHIELFGTLKDYKKLLIWIDNDNSHFREYKWFTLEKTERIRSYQYKVTFWKENLPVFAWYLWDQLNEYIETRDYFVVYGSAFRLFSLSEIVDFIDENIQIDFRDSRNKKTSHTVKRIDIAVDVKKNIEHIVSNFKELKQKWSKFFDEKGKIQTYYIWEKKNTQNKALLIRVYDKIADILQKEKQKYYPQYLKEDYVTRIELEFRSDLLKEVKLSQFLDRSYSFWLFCLYVSKHTSLFKKFENDDVSKLSRLDKKVKIHDLHHRQVTKRRYLNTFLWYAKKFLTLSACPVDVLVRHWVYQEKSIKDILIASIDGSFDIEKYKHWVTIRNAESVFADNVLEDEPWGS